MKGFMDWLENRFAPKMNKVANNIWIVTIKESIMQILPFILLGSVFCCLAIIEDYVTLPFSFWTPFIWTMNKIGFLIAFLIPFNYCEKRKYRKQRLIAGMTSILLFLMVITPQVELEGTIGFNHSAMGAGGMFAAIVLGIFVAWVFGLFAKFSFFKEDSVIPDFVKAWFDAMLPIFIVICAGWILVLVAHVDLFGIIQAVFSPLQYFSQTWYGFTLINFLSCFLYSMGISVWVLNSVVKPCRQIAIVENLALVAAGTATAATLNIYTEGLLFCTYLWIGGTGCTLPLVFLLMKARSQKLKAMGRACLVPGIFNINEPVVFSCIAWNPILMVPMWLQGIILPLLTWVACKVIAFAPIPQIQFELWYCPYPICTWISTKGSLAAILFVLITFVVGGMIWYPFFKVYDRQEYRVEQGEQAAV